MNNQALITTDVNINVSNATLMKIFFTAVLIIIAGSAIKKIL